MSDDKFKEILDAADLDAADLEAFEECTDAEVIKLQRQLKELELTFDARLNQGMNHYAGEGKAVKGMLLEMLKSLGIEATPANLAEAAGNFVKQQNMKNALLASIDAVVGDPTKSKLVMDKILVEYVMITSADYAVMQKQAEDKNLAEIADREKRFKNIAAPNVERERQDLKDRQYAERQLSIQREIDEQLEKKEAK